jgi:hypothetical protein
MFLEYTPYAFIGLSSSGSIEKAAALQGDD